MRRHLREILVALPQIAAVIRDGDKLAALEGDIRALESVIANDPPETAMEKIEAVEKAVGALEGTSKVKSPISRARRKLRGDNPAPAEALEELQKAYPVFAEEVAWRKKAEEQLLPGLTAYDDAIADTIGLRLQDRLSKAQAKEVAACIAVHRDISLSF